MEIRAMHCRPGNLLTERIIGCVIRVHTALGPGFVEKIYRRALAVELRNQGMTIEVEKEVLVFYAGRKVGRHRIDLLVEGAVIVETKTVDAFNAVHYAQVRSYMKATGLTTGLLVNFASERADFRRVSPK